MLVSLKEIGKYVDLSNLTPEEISSRLTFSGIEVEEIKYLSTATNLVIGKVIKCDSHPDSDHLHVTKVDIGSEILDIVCGAPNCKLGIKVIVAKVGAKLLNGEITKGLIRGVESNGMLCALNEIGVDPKTLKEEQIQGIEILPDDAVIGNTKVLEYLGLDDCVLDLSLLANRSDCYSLYNVAKEIGALFKREVKIPSFSDIKTFESDFKIASLSPNCKSFYAKELKNIKVDESPTWLKEILRSEGIKSINNVVDLGNYVMLLTGQPIHIYDVDKLPQRELVVKEGIDTKLIALDDKEYTLINTDLCITSNNLVMCLAGVLGSKQSEIDEKSTNILIEVANFSFASIRKTAIRLGIMSDSSQRFVKGINPSQSVEVINSISELFIKVLNVKDISQTIVYDEIDHKLKQFSCSVSYINKRLGTKFSKQLIEETLNLLNFKTIFSNDNDFNVIVPSSRIDIDGEADISEEIIRYHGFDEITKSLPYMETTVGTLDPRRQGERIIEDFLIGKGINEVITYTLINKRDNEIFNDVNLDEGIEISNPLTEDHKFIRKNILSSLLRTVQYNLNHQQSNFRLFEISEVYSKNQIQTHLSIALIGSLLDFDLINPREFDYYDMKGIVENILNLFNIALSRVKFERMNSSDNFHFGRSVKVLIDNKLLAVFGEINPRMKSEFNIKKGQCIILEMNLSVLFNVRSPKNKFSEYSRFPSVSRDYAFVIKNDINFEQIKNELKKASSLIKSINLFDIYKGDNIDEGYVSIALRTVLESLEHTLNDEHITEVDKKIREVLMKKFNVELRK